jgi:hypothetical protein
MMDTIHMMPLVSAFLSGALATAITQALISRGRRHATPTCAIPAPRSHTKEPRAEALAILEICDWNFDAAFDWTATMVTTDRGFADFWICVAECIEIFQAGRQDIPA